MLCNRILRFALVVLTFCSASAFAVTPSVNPIYNIGGNLQSGSSPLSAYQAHVIARLSLYSCVPVGVTGSGPWTGSRSCVVGGVTGTYTDLIVVDTPAVCPVGSILGVDQISCIVSTTCSTVDTLHSKGFFNIGLSPSGMLLNTACIASCGLYLHTGHAPAASSLINGVRHYFGSAEYRHTGQSCSPDTPNFLSDFVGNLSSGTCAPGQSFITMNGVTKCINSGTGEDVNAASAAAAAKTLLDQRAAAAASAAQAAATLAGASASDAVAAGVQAAAQTASADAGLLNSSDPETAAFCKDNPDASICAGQEFGTVEDATLQEKTINVAITPIAVGGAGYCPAPSPLISKQGKQYYFEWTVYCNYATGIKPIILAFAWLAAAGILVGGFRSA